ncbi:hypothetical protein FUAX_29400 [Fulvitalea axinellae]|uniref:Transposase IS30-like HTH domain-containing protein n=1 Tax=Fulvitalea axinellae TaxID=1182444 RepID=A0AAU9D3H2_9BACT|nr:hypothetical protein FUAX_29400 [Fulvitalea axinellae]
MGYYTRLNIYERLFISDTHKAGWSVRRIAEGIDRSPSTVSRELERNRCRGAYEPHLAHTLAVARVHWRASGRRPNGKTLICNLTGKYRHIFPRVFVAWLSDTQKHYRNPWRPLVGGRITYRMASLFKLSEKPIHYRRMLEALLFMMAQRKERGELVPRYFDTVARLFCRGKRLEPKADSVTVRRLVPEVPDIPLRYAG